MKPPTKKQIDRYNLNAEALEKALDTAYRTLDGELEDIEVVIDKALDKMVKGKKNKSKLLPIDREAEADEADEEELEDSEDEEYYAEDEEKEADENEESKERRKKKPKVKKSEESDMGEIIEIDRADVLSSLERLQKSGKINMNQYWLAQTEIKEGKNYIADEEVSDLVRDDILEKSDSEEIEYMEEEFDSDLLEKSLNLGCTDEFLELSKEEMLNTAEKLFRSEIIKTDNDNEKQALLQKSIKLYGAIEKFHANKQAQENAEILEKAEEGRNIDFKTQERKRKRARKELGLGRGQVDTLEMERKLGSTHIAELGIESISDALDVLGEIFHDKMIDTQTMIRLDERIQKTKTIPSKMKRLFEKYV